MWDQELHIEEGNDHGHYMCEERGGAVRHVPTTTYKNIFQVPTGIYIYISKEYLI